MELGIGAGSQKLESWGYRARKKFDDTFSCLDTIHQRDGQTDRHRATAKTALNAERRAVKPVVSWVLRFSHRYVSITVNPLT